MGRIVAYEYLTLDGVMEAPERWQFSYLSDDVAEVIKTQILDASAVLLGRITYDIFAASWPSSTKNEFGIADKLNSMPKFVVSKTLHKADWQNSTLIKGEPLQEVVDLKRQVEGIIALLGSRYLVATLMQNALIDEFRLMIHPVVLGGGQRLFQEGIHAELRLVESRTFNSGVVLLCYQPAT